MKNQFKENILKNINSLTPKEKEVVNFLDLNFDDIINFSSEEIAKNIQVTSAIVVRACKKIGYKGFLDLKKQVTSTYRNSKKKGRIATTIDLIEDNNFTKYIDSEIHFLENLKTLNNIEELKNIAKFISEKETIYIAGFGISKVIAEYFKFRLQSIGKKVILVEGTKNTLANHLVSITKNDMLISIGFQLPYDESIIALKYTSSKNILTVAITHDLTSALAPYADYLIKAPRGEENKLNSIVTPISIIHYLILELLKINKEEVTKTIKEIEGIKAMY